MVNPYEKPNEEFDWTSKAQKSRKSKCRLCVIEERRMKQREKRQKRFEEDLRVSAIIGEYPLKELAKYLCPEELAGLITTVTAEAKYC